MTIEESEKITIAEESDMESIAEEKENEITVEETKEEKGDINIRGTNQGIRRNYCGKD